MTARTWVVVTLLACGGPKPTADETDEDADADADADADSDADADADSDSDTDEHSGEPTETGDSGLASSTCSDGDGDGVSDDAEQVVLNTDPTRFDGGCLPWTRTIVDDFVPFFGDDLVLGDVDGDGDLDVLATEEYATLYWYENQGGGVFTNEIRLWDHQVWVPYYNYWTTVQGAGLAVADLTGDGVPDLVVSALDIWVLRGLGGGAFAPPLEVAQPTYDGPLTAADLDGDGDVDLVGWNGFHELAWFENVGGANLIPHRIHVGTYWIEVSPADLDGDGDLDLAYMEQGRSTAAGWLENSGGAMTWTVHDLGGFAYSVAVTTGDLDGDGVPDIVLNGSSQPGQAPSMRTWRNLGGGSFAAPVDRPGPAMTRVGDLDHDGDDDLVLLDATGLSWIPLESGAPQGQLTVGSWGQVLHLGDLDGDGWTDVVTEPGVTWYRNPMGDDTDADGLRDDAERCVAGTDPLVADSDGDGWTDGAELCAVHDPSDAADHP
ncbi:MAG: VCBS repeat-containing protein [Alphaproteobacteria bacterium]|nr:VCBS repeat-containing protein [Alphaproteobacteria bacterium]MCB9695740.1 VCBS repeat-containing protein [Alphaproteobacteria bacterium]